MNWTPVTDSLPDSDQTVLVHHPEWDEPVWIGYLYGDVWRDASGVSLDGDADPAPTHWMPFPEPPVA